MSGWDLLSFYLSLYIIYILKERIAQMNALPKTSQSSEAQAGLGLHDFQCCSPSHPGGCGWQTQFQGFLGWVKLMTHVESPEIKQPGSARMQSKKPREKEEVSLWTGDPGG